MLNGSKTYVVALGLVAYAALGYFLGDMPWQDALHAALEGSGLAALRRAI